MLEGCPGVVKKQRASGAIKSEVCGDQYVLYRNYTPGDDQPPLKEAYIGGVMTWYRSDGRTVKAMAANGVLTKFRKNGTAK
jgi:hypothetical protein